MTTTIAAPDYLRQRGFFDPEKHADAAVTFVGCGGIGSFAATAVAKLGVQNITLIDPDLVEPHNLPSQMYEGGDAETHKVEALAGHILAANPEANVEPHPLFLEDYGDLSGLVVSGLDSMAARAALWEKLKFNPRVPLYIDGRLDGQTIVIYAVKPWDLKDIEEYEATLKSDDEVEASVCTERNIIDVGFMIGSLIARQVRLHFTGIDVEKITVVNQRALNIVKGGWIEL